MDTDPRLAPALAAHPAPDTFPRAFDVVRRQSRAEPSKLLERPALTREVLGWLGEATLRELLSDESKEVRLKTIIALGRTEEPPPDVRETDGPAGNRSTGKPALPHRPTG